jgi:hypothetical protein
MAELIVELEEKFGKDYIAKMTGMVDTEISAYEEMVKIPDDFGDDLPSLEEVKELPTTITINMYPTELEDFETAIEKAVEQMEEQ